MSPKPRPLALHPKQSSRRSFLTLTALTAAGVPVVVSRAVVVLGRRVRLRLHQMGGRTWMVICWGTASR